MLSPALAQKLALAVHQAEAGVDYSARSGAICPGCGKKAPIYKTLPWDGDIRIRYHRCATPDCPLAILGRGIKSVQQERH